MSELATRYMAGHMPPEPGSDCEHDYFDTLLHNMKRMAQLEAEQAKAAAKDGVELPRPVDEQLGLLLLIAGWPPPPMCNWLENLRAATKPGEGCW